MEEAEKNEVVQVDQLPSYNLEQITILDKSWKTIRGIHSVGFYFLMATCIFGFGLLALPTQLELFLFLLLFPVTLCLINIWLIHKQYQVEGYIIREKDIYFQQGFFWTKRMVIPFNRIQHASVHQGPLERSFKLSKLRIFTAGGQSSDLTIPGLQNDEALQIKAFISEQTAQSKAGQDGEL